MLVFFLILFPVLSFGDKTEENFESQAKRIFNYNAKLTGKQLSRAEDIGEKLLASSKAKDSPAIMYHLARAVALAGNLSTERTYYIGMGSREDNTFLSMGSSRMIIGQRFEVDALSYWRHPVRWLRTKEYSGGQALFIDAPEWLWRLIPTRRTQFVLGGETAIVVRLDSSSLANENPGKGVDGCDNWVSHAERIDAAFKDLDENMVLVLPKALKCEGKPYSVVTVKVVDMGEEKFLLRPEGELQTSKAARTGRQGEGF